MTAVEEISPRSTILQLPIHLLLLSLCRRLRQVCPELTSVLWCMSLPLSCKVCLFSLLRFYLSVFVLVSIPPTILTSHDRVICLHPYSHLKPRSTWYIHDRVTRSEILCTFHTLSKLVISLY